MADERKNFKFSINKDFAKKFEKKERRAELDQLKAKYGDDVESESSSSETEDEDAKEVTPKVEKDFLTVLSLLKKKDPKIYDKNTNFYQSESSSSDENQEKSTKPQKPIYLKDYERQRLLEKGSEAFLSDDESVDGSDGPSDDEKDSKNLTYNEEQKALKDSFKSAAVGSDDEDGAFLSVREKTKEEKQNEDKDYKVWLKGVKQTSTKGNTGLEALQRFWNDPDLDPDEQFLKNYILDREYVDKDDMRIPTYDEIVNDEKEDEDELDKQEDFERKYNFRFEEPDANFIKTYPRTIRDSVRQKDDRRTDARKKREERKKKEKEQMREELKRLKNLKKKEIQEKLEKLKEITGNPNVGFTEDDVEGDFDPAHYDNIMQKVFDDGYYKDPDEEKPTFDDGLDLEEEEENWDEWEGPSHVDNHGNADQEPNGDYDDSYYDDGNFNMDADYDPSMEVQQPKRKKNKRSSTFSRALHKQKPLFDPNEKTFEEYFNEYYKLDYEDIISDVPCRFRYRKVLANDFGLSSEEILSYPERELNQWVSVKKMSQYRSFYEENKDLKKFRKLSRDAERKQRTFISQAAKSETTTAQSNQNTQLPIAGKPPTNENKSDESATQVSQQQNTNSKILKPREITTKRAATRKEFLAKKGWKKRLTPQEIKEMAQKKKLARQFKGAKQGKLAGLSAERLAAYGMKKKKTRD